MKCPHCEYESYSFWISKVIMENRDTFDKLRLYGCPECKKTFISEDE